MTYINLIAPKVEKSGFTCTRCKKHFAYDPSIILSGKSHGSYCNDCFEQVIEHDTETDDLEEVAKVFKADISNNIGKYTGQLDLGGQQMELI